MFNTITFEEPLVWFYWNEKVDDEIRKWVSSVAKTYFVGDEIFVHKTKGRTLAGEGTFYHAGAYAKSNFMGEVFLNELNEKLKEVSKEKGLI